LCGSQLFEQPVQTHFSLVGLIDTMKLSTATLGFPRMGPNRELKFALEQHWKGLTSQDELLGVAHTVEALGWGLQKDAGMNRIPVGDFALYDAVVHWTEMLGMVPSRFANMSPGLARMFAMSRGVDGSTALSKCWSFS
jgi:5-methyltetrahydropteroyltriglutamate--homocysteine methyltransferase